MAEQENEKPAIKGTKGRKPYAPGVSRKHVSKADKQYREDVAENLKTSAQLSCPRTLSAAAKAKWRSLMRLYRQMPSQILNDLDKDALSQYCEAYAVWAAAQHTWAVDLKGENVCTTNQATQAFIDKTIATMDRESAIMARLAEQLCLTPVGRARMGMNPAAPKKPTKLLDFLNES